MRRTAWLVVSPWLAVAVAGVVGLGVWWGLTALWTTGDGGLGDLGPALLAVACGAGVCCAGSVALLWLAARRVLAPADARRAVARAVGAAVALLVVLGAAAGVLDTGGALIGAVVLPALLPAAGTVSFLLVDRGSTARRLPGSVRTPRAVSAADVPALAFLPALAGLLVGATVGAVVDVALLGPSPRQLQAEAVALVPDGFAVDAVTEINGGGFVAATARDAAVPGTVEVAARAAGWDVVRPPTGGRGADLLRPGLVAYAGIDDGGRDPRFSASVYRASSGLAPALVGGSAGALAAGAAAVLVARRRSRHPVAPPSGTGAPTWGPVP